MATVYVDDTFDWLSNEWKAEEWCHMWTDGNDADLMEFAAKIGLKPQWLQIANPRFHHFALRPAMRLKALEHGAKYLPLRDWIKRQQGDAI